MKRLLSLLFVAAAALGASAQSTPIVTAIHPTSGPSAGGTEVSITGQNLLPAIVCILPCPAKVTFGGITVVVEEETDTELVAITPAHPAGIVDVIVEVAGRDPVRLHDAFTFQAGPETNWEQVLLPIYLDQPIPGAHGSRWVTELWVRNSGTEQVALAPWPCPPPLVCPPVWPLPFHLTAGFSMRNLPAGYNPASPNPSRLLYVERQGAAGVHFGLRFADLSRSTLNAGTEMPVIREGELLTRPAELFDVPLDTRFRVMLRVYDATYTNSRFRVTIHAQAEHDANPVHSVELTAATPQEGEFRTEAAYAQLDVTDLLRMEKVWPPNARLVITPLKPGSRYWAFASITNNETQMVTLVTPQ